VSNSVLQLKRKKIKELLMAGPSGGVQRMNNNYTINSIEKEDLQM